MEIKLNIPDDLEKLKTLKAGDEVKINGIIYSARDQAHARFFELLDTGRELPVPLKETLIYYLGPSPAKPGGVIGSAGPTISGRMDPFTPRLLDLGLAGMIGKGPRNSEVQDAIVRNQSIYFYAFGGCGALYAEAFFPLSTIWSFN